MTGRQTGHNPVQPKKGGCRNEEVSDQGDHILLVMAMLAVSSLPTKPLLAAEAQREVSSDKVASSAQDLEEAEVARALAFDSQELRQMRQLTAAEGLQLETDRQPLAFLREENGQRLYTADRQAVLFLGEKEGRRIYQVFLGFEESPRFPKRPVPWPVWEKEPAREASLVFAFVDVAAQEVLDVVRMDISRMDRDGAQKIVMRSSTGRQSQYLTTKNGAVQEITQDGVVRIDDVSIGQRQCGVQPSDVKCSIICGFVSIVSCAIITAATGGLLTIICAAFAVVMCAFICEGY